MGQRSDPFLGKVAQVQTSTQHIADAVAARRRVSERGSVTPRTLTSGRGWRILDVMCTCDAQDRPGEERHSHYSLAMVLGGAFHYRGRDGAAFLPAGSILIGQAGAQFSCWHDYGAGDRCLAVQFEAEAFQELLASRGAVEDLRTWPVALPVDRRTAGMFASAELIAASSLPPIAAWHSPCPWPTASCSLRAALSCDQRQVEGSRARARVGALD